MSIYNINFIEICLLQKFYSVYLNGNKHFTTYLHYPKKQVLLYIVVFVCLFRATCCFSCQELDKFSESLRFKNLYRQKTAGIACQRTICLLSFILTLASAQYVFKAETVIVILLCIKSLALHDLAIFVILTSS